MPVNDLSGASDLPWWATQGTPVGATGGQQPPGGNGAGWLQYLTQMFGIGPAEAATMIQGQDHGSGDIPPVPPFVGPPPAPQRPAPPTQGPPGYLNSTSAIVPPAPAVAPGYAGSTGAGSGDPRLADAALNRMNNMAPGLTNPGYVPPGISPGRVNPDAPTAPAQPVRGPLAPGGAGGVGATSNPRFAMIYRPNAPAGGSPYGASGAPQMSALNLAGLFGGGPQGGPAAAPMGGGPVRGPLASGSGSISMDDLYPARAAMRGMPPGQQSMTPTQLAGAVGQPNWWQNLGRANMTPAQLAGAIRKPNWWQNLTG
jgi:hypothetical protein